MKCPHDGTQLQAVDVGGVEIDKCHQCDGLWLDYGELKTIRKMDLGEIEEQLEQQYGNPTVRPAETNGYMRCPRCGESGRLMRHHVSYYVKVQIDRCQQCHGMWLDDQELDALLRDKQKMDQDLSCPGFLAVCRAIEKFFSSK